MQTFVSRILSIAVLSMALSSGFAQGIAFTSTDWKTTLEKATVENKLIFMDAYTTWCGPCKMLDKQTFNQPEVGEFFNENYINLKMDMEKGEGIALAANYMIQAYPTLLFINGAGEVVHRAVGFHKPEELVALGQLALNPEQRLQTLDRRYQNGDRDPDFLFSYAYTKKQAYSGGYLDPANDYMKSQKDLHTARNLEFIYDFAEYVDDAFFKYMVHKRDIFESHYGRNAVFSKFESVLDDGAFLNAPDWVALQKTIGSIFPGQEERYLLSMKMAHFQANRQQPEFIAAATDYIKGYAGDDADLLNEIAWSFYEWVDDPKALKQAVKWAQKSVKLQSEYHNNDTLAALYAKLGQKSKAMKAGQKAIELAKATGQDYQMTQELLDKL